MEYIPDQINYKETFKKYDPIGRVVVYSLGDVVEYLGKKYIATKTIKGIPPSSKESGWKEYDMATKYFINEIEPLKSNEGDRWFNPINGVLYTRVLDDNGYHWVEL